MLTSKARIRGKVTVTVFGIDGKVKRQEPNWFQKLLGLPGRLMISVNHNIVTDQGDALVADLMSTSPVRTKVDNTNGRIGVGTGWTGTTPKANVACNTPTGALEVLDATYPKLKGAWGAANDNVTQYRATFEAGDLNVSGIDEVALSNATVDNLAYAQITPEVNVTSSDTLQCDWELIFTGS